MLRFGAVAQRLPIVVRADSGSKATAPRALSAIADTVLAPRWPSDSARRIEFRDRVLRRRESRPNQLTRRRRIKSTTAADKLTTITMPRTSDPASGVRFLGSTGINK
jgi:hypothetical protein